MRRGGRVCVVSIDMYVEADTGTITRQQDSSLFSVFSTLFALTSGLKINSLSDVHGTFRVHACDDS